MSMFGGRSPSRVRPLPPQLEATRSVGGAYEVQPSDVSGAPPQGFSSRLGGPQPGAIDTGSMTDEEQRRAMLALRQQEAQGYSPADLRMISQGEAPQRRGMIGGGSGFGKIIRGAGKVLETVGAVAAFGPFGPMVLRDMKENRSWREQERAAELELRQAQAGYYRAQANAKDDGIQIVGSKAFRLDPTTGRPEVIVDGSAASDREKWLAELDDPSTTPARRANLERVLGITPAPTDRKPSYQVDDAGNVFAIDEGGVRRIGGGLYKRPPQDRPDITTPGEVVGPILEKLRRGERITPYEQQVLDYSKPRDPMDELIRRSMGGGPSMPAPPPAPRPSARIPGLDANGNEVNPFGLNRPPAPPAMLGRATPPRPNPGGASGKRVRLPPGYTPAKARAEAAQAIKRNPRARAEVIRRLQDAGVATAGL